MNKTILHYLKKRPAVCGAICGVVLYILLKLAFGALAEAPVCPNCGKPLTRQGDGYACTELHCGYHS